LVSDKNSILKLKGKKRKMFSPSHGVPVGVGMPIKTIRQAAQKLMKEFPETSTSTGDVHTMLHDLEQLLMWMLGLDVGSQCSIEIKQRAACLSSGSIFRKLSLENQQPIFNSVLSMLSKTLARI